MAVVVDASAIADMLLNAPSAPWLRERFRGDRLHAPHLIDLEVFQVLRKHRLTDELAAGAIRQHRDLTIDRYPHHWFVPRIWDLRFNFTAYDAMYVALAEALRAPLVTTDGPLAKAAARFVEVDVP